MLFAALAYGDVRPTTSTLSGLPGRAMVLYPSEAAAVARCNGSAVVFVDDPARRYYRNTDTAYGAWGDDRIPNRGFGCERDVIPNGLVRGQ